MLDNGELRNNSSGDDWSNVRLAVVSGRPVSLISRLYDPKYVERQSAELAESAPVGPTVHEGFVADLAAAPPPPAPAPVAEGAEIGELLEYASPRRTNQTW